LKRRQLIWGLTVTVSAGLTGLEMATGWPIAIAGSILLAVVGSWPRARAHEPPPASISAPLPVPVEEPRCAAAPGPDVATLSAEAAFYQDCLRRLSESATDRLLTTTQPISDEILAIRDTIGTFVRRVDQSGSASQSHEANLKIASNREEMKNDMDKVALAVQEGFSGFERTLRILTEALKNITDTSRQIEDISQRINVLSINAAIEAARAGTSGRGFKIISDHIRSLAAETSEVIVRIHASVAETSRTFQGVAADLQNKRGTIETILEDQTQSFSGFYQTFGEQAAQFTELHRQIMTFIGQISSTVQVISPLAQLHEIAIQEMQNLSLVQTDYLDSLRGTLGGESGRRWDAGSAVERIRFRLTTAQELEALQVSAQNFGYRGSLRTSAKAVEFF
jgi:hypothetical protein